VIRDPGEAKGFTLKPIEERYVNTQYLPSNGVNTPWAREFLRRKMCRVRDSEQGSLRETEK
jgi:hypothetical protein